MNYTIEQLKQIDAGFISRDLKSFRMDGSDEIDRLTMAEKARVAKYWNRYHPKLVHKKQKFVFSDTPQDTDTNLSEFTSMSTVGQLKVINQMIEENSCTGCPNDCNTCNLILE